MSSDLAQVLIALALFTSILVVLGLILRPYRARWAAANELHSECDELRQEVADLEQELRTERTRRRVAESKAEEFDALDLLYETSKRVFEGHIKKANTAAHRNQLKLDLVRRNVPGADDYIAGIDAEIAQASATQKRSTVQ